MAKHIITAGATSQRFYIYLQNSTTGQGQAGVSTATCYYLRDSVSGSMPTAVTLTFGAVFASPGTYPSWTSGQVREIGYMPGIYLIDIPDAVFAVSAKNAVVQITPVTGTAWLPVNLEFSLSAVDMNDSVRMGMTALPNTSVSTNGSLITAGTGTNQLSTTSGAVSANTTQWGGTAVTGMPMPTYTQPTGFLSATFPGGTIANTTNITAGTIASVTNAVTVGTINNNVITAASISSGAVAGDVWNALLASYTTVNTFGARVVRTIASPVTNEVSINASNHIAANVHQMQNNTITAAAIATDAIDADALATDAVTEIAAGAWTYDISAISLSGQAGRYITDIKVDTTNIASSVTTIEAVAYRQSIADYLLGRNLAGGSDGGRTVKDALRALRNKSEIVGTTLTVYQENDTSSAWTATVSSSASADPVTGIDPA